MFKTFKRNKIKKAILHHQQMYRSILYARGYTKETFIADIHKQVDTKDELLHRVYCEERCVKRLEKLLRKIK